LAPRAKPRANGTDSRRPSAEGRRDPKPDTDHQTQTRTSISPIARPADSGTFQQDDDTLAFTSGEHSEACAPGSMLVIEEPVVFFASIGNPDQPGPAGELERAAFHGNVLDDGCSRMSGPTTWIQLSP
jgi:hypothetical protein